MTSSASRVEALELGLGLDARGVSLGVGHFPAAGGVGLRLDAGGLRSGLRALDDRLPFGFGLELLLLDLFLLEREHVLHGVGFGPGRDHALRRRGLRLLNLAGLLRLGRQPRLLDFLGFAA